MGVEPTAARSARPATDFEDRGAHRDPTTPALYKDTPILHFRQVGALTTRPQTEIHPERYRGYLSAKGQLAPT